MSAGGPGFVSELARSVAAAEVSDAARDVARTAMLDTAACATAGWQSEQAMAVRRAQVSAGATGAGPVALALGTAAHALDYDDYEEPGSTHPSAVLVPVIVGLSGHRKITFSEAEVAYVSGYRAILALGQAMGYGHYMAGWHATSTLGCIGAAVCAARLLELDTNRLGHAISLAMTQASGMKVQFGFGTKAVHAGLAARNGIEAASLAAGGVCGAPGAFEGETGFAALYGGRGTAFAGLPEVEAFPPWQKMSPSCGYTLRSIDAAVDLFEQGIDSEAIQMVRVEMAAPYARVVPYRAPSTAAEARFSVSWCVAVALCDGHVAPSHFEQEALRRPDLTGLEARVRVETYPLPDGAGDMAESAPDKVVLQLANGDTVQASCALPRGAPDRSVSEEEFAAKLRTCGVSAETARAFRTARSEAVLTREHLFPEIPLEAV